MPGQCALPAQNETRAGERLDGRRLFDGDGVLIGVRRRDDLSDEWRESIATLRRRGGRAQERVAGARLGDARADTRGKRVQQRGGSGEHEQRRQERVAEGAVDHGAPSKGSDVALERGARERSVERRDERVSELGNALLEPERDGWERAHAPAAIEGVGGCRDTERRGRWEARASEARAERPRRSR